MHRESPQDYTRAVAAASAGPIHGAATGARCVFAEPQFEPRLVGTIIEGTGARSGVLDPLGAGIAPGPDAWFELMRALADGLHACLSPR